MTMTDARVPDQVPESVLAAWEMDSLLIDGRAVHLRPIRLSDGPVVQDFYRSLSQESMHLRFFGAVAEISERELDRTVNVDYRTRMAFAACARGEMIGIARYDLTEDESVAEVSFVVADAYQGQGVGTLLLESLAAYARERGIAEFVAETLPENAPMIAVFAAAGLNEVSRFVDGTVRVRLNLEPTHDYIEQREQRERVAAAASVANFLRPRTIAVIGAGRAPGGIGHQILRALLAGDFAGTVYPVNPRATSICGVHAYPKVTAIPAEVDLAVICVPAPAVLEVAQECADAKAHSLVIISAGFAETGHDGAAIEAELLSIARAAGMRVVGPNCLGVSSTDPEVRANATFSPVAPTPGRLGLFSQSGAVGVVLLEEAARVGLGISSFVSVGNKLDVSGNDCMCFWEDDPGTDVIAMYLESVGNPRKFLRIARRVGRKKPIVALKAGRTVAGARGARSHTAAAATPAVASDALLSAAGVVAVEHLDDLLDMVATLTPGVLPRGRRVALVGNSGGPLILAADACSSAGLEVQELKEQTQQQLRAFVSSAAAVQNPVDVTADGGAPTLARALAVLLDDTEVDAVIAVVTPLAQAPREEVIDALGKVATAASKPVVACVFGESSARDVVRARESNVVVLPSPERAASALEKAARYALWRAIAEPRDAKPDGVQLAAAHSVVDRCLNDHTDGGWLDADDAAQLLKAFGIAVVETIPASGVEDALAAAEKIGYPVALKAAGGAIVHKTEAGGVALGLKGPDELERAYKLMASRLGDALRGVVVQTMARPGVEAIVGLTVDAGFGPLLMFGLGGVATDLLGDHAFAVPPLKVGDAERLVESIHAVPLFHGYRGSDPVDVAALSDAIERVGAIAELVPEVVELDLNPITVSSTGAIALDWKVRIAPRPTGPDPYMRVLRRRAGMRVSA
jgi:acyl-CoA synthetase (NDP forming)/RimJ/RimL family protein N-acetyltransferase